MEEVLIVKISRGAYSLAEILTTKRFRRIEYCPERNEFKIWERSYRRLEIKKGHFWKLSNTGRESGQTFRNAHFVFRKRLQKGGRILSVQNK